MQVTIDVTNEPEEGEPVPAEGKDTRQVDLITLQEDDYFGEFSLLAGTPGASSKGVCEGGGHDGHTHPVMRYL